MVPLVLCSGGVALGALEYCFPGDGLGYEFPNFLAKIQGAARKKGSSICPESSERRHLFGCWRVRRTRGADSADRRLHRGHNRSARGAKPGPL